MFGGKFFLNEIMVLILLQSKSPLNARLCGWWQLTNLHFNPLKVVQITSYSVWYEILSQIIIQGLNWRC